MLATVTKIYVTDIRAETIVVGSHDADIYDEQSVA
jgi:hypothetical protein